MRDKVTEIRFFKTDHEDNTTEIPILGYHVPPSTGDHILLSNILHIVTMVIHRTVVNPMKDTQIISVIVKPVTGCDLEDTEDKYYDDERTISIIKDS